MDTEKELTACAALYNFAQHINKYFPGHIANALLVSDGMVLTIYGQRIKIYNDLTRAEEVSTEKVGYIGTTCGWSQSIE